MRKVFVKSLKLLFSVILTKKNLPWYRNSEQMLRTSAWQKLNFAEIPKNNTPVSMDDFSRIANISR
jgi:glutamate mutase epsilon subunit